MGLMSGVMLVRMSQFSQVMNQITLFHFMTLMESPQILIKMTVTSRLWIVEQLTVWLREQTSYTALKE